MMEEKFKKIINIPVNSVFVEGELTIPKNASGIIIFAHGSGSNRMSPRNNYVAKILQEKNLATLLVDFLAKGEDLSFNRQYDINFLTERLIKITNWIKDNDETKALKIGYFGASTGAASAIKAAAIEKENVDAIVSRGGRVDLAEAQLSQIQAPTLLIVGENDEFVIEVNKLALEKIECTKQLSIIPNASHLFEEPGTMQEVALKTAQWFIKFFNETKEIAKI